MACSYNAFFEVDGTNVIGDGMFDEYYTNDNNLNYQNDLSSPPSGVILYQQYPGFEFFQRVFNGTMDQYYAEFGNTECATSDDTSNEVYVHEAITNEGLDSLCYSYYYQSQVLGNSWPFLKQFCDEEAGPIYLEEFDNNGDGQLNAFPRKFNVEDLDEPLYFYRNWTCRNCTNITCDNVFDTIEQQYPPDTDTSYRWVSGGTPQISTGKTIDNFNFLNYNHPTTPYFTYRPVRQYVLGCSKEYAVNYQEFIENYIIGENIDVCFDDSTCFIQYCNDNSIGYSPDLEGICRNGNDVGSGNLCSNNFTLNSEPTGYKFSNYLNIDNVPEDGEVVACQDSLIYSSNSSDCNYIEDPFEFVPNPIQYSVSQVSDQGNVFQPQGTYEIQTCCPVGEIFTNQVVTYNYHMGIDITKYGTNGELFVDRQHYCCLDQDEPNTEGYGVCDNPNVYQWFCRTDGVCGDFSDCSCPTNEFATYIEAIFGPSSNSKGCTYESATNFYTQEVCNLPVEFDGCGGECIPGICPYIDDGSCLFGNSGCTDINSPNYNAGATFDDGSCTYLEPDESIIFKNKFFENLTFSKSVVNQLQNIKYAAVIYKINNNFINENDVIFVELEERDCDYGDSGFCHKPIGGFFNYSDNNYIDVYDVLDYFYVVIDEDIEFEDESNNIIDYDYLKPKILLKDFVNRNIRVSARKVVQVFDGNNGNSQLAGYIDSLSLSEESYDEYPDYLFFHIDNTYTNGTYDNMMSLNESLRDFCEISTDFFVNDEFSSVENVISNEVTLINDNYNAFFISDSNPNFIQTAATIYYCSVNNKSYFEEVCNEECVDEFENFIECEVINPTFFTRMDCTHEQRTPIFTKTENFYNYEDNIFESYLPIINIIDGDLHILQDRAGELNNWSTSNGEYVFSINNWDNDKLNYFNDKKILIKNSENIDILESKITNRFLIKRLDRDKSLINEIILQDMFRESLATSESVIVELVVDGEYLGIHSFTSLPSSISTNDDFVIKLTTSDDSDFNIDNKYHYKFITDNLTEGDMSPITTFHENLDTGRLPRVNTTSFMDYILATEISFNPYAYSPRGEFSSELNQDIYITYQDEQIIIGNPSENTIGFGNNYHIWGADYNGDECIYFNDNTIEAGNEINRWVIHQNDELSEEGSIDLIYKDLFKKIITSLYGLESTADDLLLRYNDLRGNALNIENLQSKIDRYYDYLLESFELNKIRWRNFDKSNLFADDGYDWPMVSIDEIKKQYIDEIDNSKKWLNRRIKWIDHNIRGLETQLNDDKQCANCQYDLQACNDDFLNNAFCDDEIAANFNVDSNFNDGRCDYNVDSYYVFNLNTSYVLYPPIENIQLQITNINGIDVDEKYNMDVFGDDNYRVVVADLEKASLVTYRYIKFIEDIYNDVDGSVEYDSGRTIYIDDEHIKEYNDLFNDFNLIMNESNLPIIKINTNLNDCQTIGLNGEISQITQENCNGFYCPDPDGDGNFTCIDTERSSFYESKAICQLETLCITDCIQSSLIPFKTNVTSEIEIYYSGLNTLNELDKDFPQSRFKIDIKVDNEEFLGDPKKQYKFRIKQNQPHFLCEKDEDYTSPQSIICEPESADINEDLGNYCAFNYNYEFSLISMYSDDSYIRTRIGQDIYRNLNQNYLNIISPSKYVELMINDTYQGVYLLQESINQNTFDNNVDFIIKSNPYNSNPDFISSEGHLRWEYFYPEKYEITNDDIDLIDNYSSNPTSDVNQEIVDLVLFNEFIYNKNGWWQGIFKYKYVYSNQSRLIFPLQFDNLLGSLNQPSTQLIFGTAIGSPQFGLLPKIYLLHYADVLTSTFIDSEINSLEETLEENYKNLADTYYNLRLIGNLRINNLMDKINNLYEELSQNNSINKDNLRWYSDDNLDESVGFLKLWLMNRINFLDNYYIEGDNSQNYMIENGVVDFEFTKFAYPINDSIFNINKLSKIKFNFFTKGFSELNIVNRLTQEIVLKTTITDLQEYFWDVTDFNQIGEFTANINMISDLSGLNFSDTINFTLVDKDINMGCTDIDAVNFDVDATDDDGSCKYEDDCDVKYSITEIDVSREFEVFSGSNTISYPLRQDFYIFDFFNILDLSYSVGDDVSPCSSDIYVNVNSNSDFCENDTVVILKGSDDEHYTATFLNGEWKITGDYNLDINSLIEPGMGLILTVERPGTISWRVG